jgi:hypothetical protein
MAGIIVIILWYLSGGFDMFLYDLPTLSNIQDILNDLHNYFKWKNILAENVNNIDIINQNQVNQEEVVYVPTEETSKPYVQVVHQNGNYDLEDLLDQAKNFSREILNDQIANLVDQENNIDEIFDLDTLTAIEESVKDLYNNNNM